MDDGQRPITIAHLEPKELKRCLCMYVAVQMSDLG